MPIPDPCPTCHETDLRRVEILREWLQTINPYSNASGRCGFCAEREDRPHLPACIVRRTVEAVA